MVNYQSCILYNYTNEENRYPVRNHLVILNATLIGYCILLVYNLFISWKAKKAQRLSWKALCPEQESQCAGPQLINKNIYAE